MIDWERVDELRDEIGAEDLADVIDMFLDEVAEKLQDVQAGTSTASLSEDMHFLKSSALNIGFADLAQLCSTAEAQAEAGDTDVDIAEIVTCFAASSKELRQNEAIKAA